MTSKRVLLILTLVFAVISASAQSGFGIKAGVNFQAEDAKGSGVEALAGYHAGVAYNLDLPLGFSFQPSLMYSVRGAGLGEKLTLGSLELMTSLQWGPDLLVFRPFVDVSPFACYGVNGKWDESGLSRFQYGIGLGGGVDIWHLQVVCRYNWNFGGMSLSLAYFF